MMAKEKEWHPEIMYQDDSMVPFVEIPVDQDMPDKLFMWGYKHTGEVEPGPEGEDVPVCDTDIHLYIHYNTLKDAVDPALLDLIRVAVGLEPLASAKKKGEAITKRVLENIDGSQENSEG